MAAVPPLYLGVMHGDLGISLKSRLPVWEEFVPRFKATLELGVCAMIFAVAVGIPVGVLAAVKRGSIFDHTAVGLALTGYSMPIFWWGMMLIMLVSVQWNLTPVSGRVSDMVFLDDSNPLTGFMLIDTAIWGEEATLSMRWRIWSCLRWCWVPFLWRSLCV